MPAALAALFAARQERPRVLVLNACDSVMMARALRPLADAVIGMRDAVEDAAHEEPGETSIDRQSDHRRPDGVLVRTVHPSAPRAPPDPRQLRTTADTRRFSTRP